VKIERDLRRGSGLGKDADLVSSATAQSSKKEEVVNNIRRKLIVSSSGASEGTPPPPSQYVSPREKKLKKLGGEQSKSNAEGFAVASSVEDCLELSWFWQRYDGRELREFVKRFALIVLYVLETKIHKARVESLKSTLGYDNSFAVNSAGHSGGLGVFWNNNTRVDILPHS